MANLEIAALTALIEVVYEDAARHLSDDRVAEYRLKYIRTAGWGGVDDELQGLVAEVIQDVAGPTDHEAYRTWQRAGELFREGYGAARAVVQCDDPKET